MTQETVGRMERSGSFVVRAACHSARMKNTANIQLSAGEERPHKGGDISDLDDFYAGNLLPKGGE